MDANLFEDNIATRIRVIQESKAFQVFKGFCDFRSDQQNSKKALNEFKHRERERERER